MRDKQQLWLEDSTKSHCSLLTVHRHGLGRKPMTQKKLVYEIGNQREMVAKATVVDWSSEMPEWLYTTVFFVFLDKGWMIANF